ncbi:hypothetical protein EZV62_022569 [Acer yangbiense]|uniref:Uncharacterized protein n=1 Tax=Acer yangbiense TaxID=1000413 RepID=A0A5C7H8P3_9ROSI|nr:hypothetical protein EZV62_022569 [Acer yangbiense]
MMESDLLFRFRFLSLSLSKLFLDSQFCPNCSSITNFPSIFYSQTKGVIRSVGVISDFAVFPLFADIPCFCACLVSRGWWVVEGAGVVLLPLFVLSLECLCVFLGLCFRLGCLFPVVLFNTKASFSSFSIIFTFKMEEKRSDLGEDHSNSQGHKMKTTESHKKYANRDAMSRSDLWTDGLICAFEFIRGHKRSTNSKVPSRTSDGDHSKMPVPVNRLSEASSQKLDRSKLLDSSSKDEFRSNQKSPFSDYRDSDNYQSGHLNATERFDGSHWVG